MMERVYIGLGSNLATPLLQLRSALAGLAALPHTRLIAPFKAAHCPVRLFCL